MRRLIKSFIGLIVLVVITVAYLLWPHSASAAWFDDSYGYRKKVTFGNTGSADSNKKVKYDVDTATLITEGKLQSDCDDIRFTDQNGKLLPHYLDSAGGACNNASTDFYLVLPTVNAGDTVVYVYYGNSSANSISGNQFSESTFSPTSGPSFSSEEKGQTPVLYWKFDDTGSTVKDSSPYGNHGEYESAVLQKEDMCVIGMCIKTETGLLGLWRSYDAELDPGTGSMSFSIWFRHPAAISTDEYLIHRYASTGGYGVYMNSSGNVCFGIDDDSSWGPDDSVCSTSSYNDNVWHHVMAVKNTTSSLVLYVDGNQVTINSSLTATGSISGNSPILAVGNNYGDSLSWNGFFDELKLFNYAKTAVQIKTDYQSRGAADQVAVDAGANNRLTALSGGLTGYWKLDETSGNAADSSGNALTLTNNGTTTFVTGKFVKGSEHVPASSQYLSTATTVNGVKTVSFWVNPDTTTNYYISLTSSAYITSSAGTISATGFTNPIMYVNGQVSSTIAADVWQLVTVTTDTAINANTLYLGRQGSNYYDGTLDEVRIYTRALSGSDVRALYDWSPGPLGYWKLDEGTGTAASDSSGSGLNGTLTNGPVWRRGVNNSGVLFDGGTAHNSDVIELGDQASLELQTITIEAWVYRSGSCNFNICTIFAKGMSGTIGYSLELFDSSGYKVRLNIRDNQQTLVGTTTIAANTWYHVAGSFDGSTIKVYVNGILENSATQTATPTFSTEGASIGNRNSNRDLTFNGVIDNVIVYPYARASKQIISDMNEGHPVVGTPVSAAAGHWGFDEGYGTTAQDKSPNDNDLTFSSAGWTAGGKSGKAYSGASNRRLTRNDDSDFDFLSSESFTISLWLKGLAEAQQYLVYKVSGTTGYSIHEFDDAFIHFCTGDAGSASFPEDCIDTYVANPTQWNHIVVVKDGTSAIRIYVNGLLKNSDTTLGATGDLVNSAKLIIGDANETDGTDEWLGSLDEIKIYRFALNDEQVKTEYNQAKTQVYGAVSTASDGVSASYSSEREYCVPGETASCSGPVIELRYDENTGTTANDTSSNGNTGTLTSGPKWAVGKHGSGVLLDGSDDYVIVTDATSLDLSSSFTVSTWIKPLVFPGVGNYDTFIDKAGTGAPANYYFELNNTDEINCGFHDGGSYKDHPTSAANLSTNTWYHVSCVFDDTNNTVKIYVNGREVYTAAETSTPATNNADLIIGRAGAFGNGQATNALVDQLRIYNYARSSSQVSWDYNRGGPAGWWKFDECSGATAYDASGNGYNGTVTPGNNTGDNDTVGTCNSGVTTEMWNDGTDGKYSSSLDFDGTNDYVDIGDKDFLNAISLSAWIYWDAATIEDGIISKRTSNEVAGNWAFRMNDTADGKLQWHVWSGVNSSINVRSTGTLATGTWNHVTLTFNNSTNTTKIYINGKLDTTDTSVTNDILDTSESVRIGHDGQSSAAYFDGRIDDVRIYNYVLTDAQVRNVLNENAAIRFGPQTGSP